MPFFKTNFPLVPVVVVKASEAIDVSDGIPLPPLLHLEKNGEGYVIRHHLLWVILLFLMEISL